MLKVYQNNVTSNVVNLNSGINRIHSTGIFREQLELEEAKRHQFHAKGVGETLPKFKYGGMNSFALFYRRFDFVDGGL